jgi:D-3-phosphoglycerate dehydrogenase / 2-oxoglutarate reductase
MKIVIADSLPPSAIERLRESDWIVDARSGRPPAALALDLADADALIIRSSTKVDRTLLAAAPKLRVVARAGTGVDNVDIVAATERGIVVLNAPGANSVSVAEHAFALILALAKRIPAADASMKATRWEKSKFTGGELRSKVLGIVGLGRVGQEVASRAHAFGMEVLAHDPFISAQVASDLGVELVTLEDLCRRSDHITLHLPSTPATRRLFNAERLAQCKKGVRLINTARGDLIDERALMAAIESGQVGGAALDVFDNEPPGDWRLASLPQVIATPHIAASTREAQEMVGIDTASAVRDFLREGIVRNAVNFPSVSLEEYKRLHPYLLLAERLGSIVAQLGEARTEAVGVRYYGELASENSQLLGSAVLVGLFGAMLSSDVTPVNARTVASQRGIELIESRSSRPRNFTSLISVRLHTSAGERWVEGAAFENGSLRLVLVNGVAVEAPLEGTMLIIANRDQPGVIGEVGSLLGRHGVNIANFALGRGTDGAVGVVNVDEAATAADSGVITDQMLSEIRAVSAVRAAWLIRV